MPANCQFRRGPSQDECVKMGLDYHDTQYYCPEMSMDREKFCRNHYIGHNTLKQNMYFSRRLQQHVCELEHKPEYKDLKYSFLKKAFFLFDGKKWRKSCEVCWCQVKSKSKYCKNHDPEYLSSSKISKTACQFLDELEKELNCSILHYHVSKEGLISGSEYKIPGTDYSTDGYIPETKTVYEFLGDYWHGNPLTQNPANYNKRKQTHAESFNQTFRRLKQIADRGYTVYYIWEQTYNQIKNNPDKKVSEHLTWFDPSQVPHLSTLKKRTFSETDIESSESCS